MGTQIHAGENIAAFVEIVKAGVSKQPITEVHVWCGSKGLGRD